MQAYKIDTRKLVADLGGLTEVSRRLAEMGVPKTTKAVEKWRERERVDAAIVLNLFAHAYFKDGRTFDLLDYAIPI